MFHQLETIPMREVMPCFRARMLHSSNMTFAFWEIAAGGILPEHDHPHEQVAILLEGRFELTVRGETSVLVPGTVAVIPSHARHSGRALSDCRICDVFYPIREDYQRLNSLVPPEAVRPRATS
ncbi:MAG: cupin domain-containing protein [Verrucomicrobia bacterium]|nr:cupin domain-containing protein [Verrucomicrobiota bacterium]